MEADSLSALYKLIVQLQTASSQVILALNNYVQKRNLAIKKAEEIFALLSSVA